MNECKEGLTYSRACLSLKMIGPTPLVRVFLLDGEGQLVSLCSLHCARGPPGSSRLVGWVYSSQELHFVLWL